MKAALYTRVSKEDQLEGFSLQAQLNMLKQYCIKNNIEVFDIYADEGISGQKEKRPEFQRMIKDSDKYQIVLVHKFDRFARKVELSSKIKSELRKKKVRVISITEPIEDSPIGFLQEGILDLLSEYYVRNLSVEVKKGLNERARQGLHKGLAPYGYRNVNREIEIHQDEAKIVRLIFDMYLQGIGCTGIARKLQEMNVMTGRGLNFSFSGAHRILKNPFYAGKILHNGEILDGIHEAIIDIEQYNKVQDEMSVRNTNPKVGRPSYRTWNYYFFYLLDILKCEHCGGNFCITGKKQQYKRYICNRAYRYTGKCDIRISYNAKKLENTIEKLLKDFMQHKIDFDIPTNNKSNINSILTNRLDKINPELDRAKNAYLAGIFNLEEYKDVKNKLENEALEIKSELNKPVKLSNTKEYRNKLKEIWSSFIQERDIGKKRFLLKKVIDSIYIDKDGKLRIVFNIF